MTETPPRRGPLVLDLGEEAQGPGPEAAPPVPDLEPPSRATAMQSIAVLAARRRSPLARWFWGIAAALFHCTSARH